MSCVVANFLVGPAGSGKSFRCLTEIRAALAASPEGPPLVLLAPKQSTYQLERALLSTFAPMGYTRLHVLSFERLAEMVFDRLEVEIPELLSEEARIMVLRSILERRRMDLKLFRASSRLTGFAEELATLLDELHRHDATPETLSAAAERLQNHALALKLRDIAVLFADYNEWLEEHHLRDVNFLLTGAAALLTEAPQTPTPLFFQIWADGFADFSAQEASFLAAVARHTGKLTVTLCIGPSQSEIMPWMSNWASPKRSMQRCAKAFASAGLSGPITERIQSPSVSRFQSNEVLSHIESSWGSARPYSGQASVPDHLRVIGCPDPETEIREAAREIRRFVRKGGHYRDVVLLARRMEPFLPFIKRVFPQFDIPIFVDRREDISHHPLAELTRSALRSVALGWRPEDWFTALKTGLVSASEQEIDRLENEALAHGWRGDVWEKPDLGNEHGTDWIPPLLRKLMPPFTRFRDDLTKRSKGAAGSEELAAAIRGLWERLRVEEKLHRWAEGKEDGIVSGEAHLTVWSQVNDWLEDVEIAFGKERLNLRDWLPILEAGLNKLSVGIIPPALDQVLIGSIERSRNCEAQLVILAGLNEKSFPAPREQSALLTDNERATLNELEVTPAESARDQMSREQHLGYLAFTRAAKRLVVTYSSFDSQGAVLNPSPFLSQLGRLFPGLTVESPAPLQDWRQAEHPHELIMAALPHLAPAAGQPAKAASFGAMPPRLLKLKQVAEVLKAVESLSENGEPAHLGRSMALRLYGTALKTSVSRMEQFAACPFKFFVNSGLDAKERTTFELDAREKGSFQHEVLSEFHERLRAEGKRWRDVSAEEARALAGRIVDEKAVAYRDGLLRTSEQTRFAALLIKEALQDFVQTLVEWMHSQNLFDPVAAELPFGEEKGCPALILDLGDGLKLSLHGRIDRVDLYAPEGSDRAYCVVTDYKSSVKKLNNVMVQNGLQLQLLSYLNVLRHWPDPGKIAGTAKLAPAGVFYVNLKGSWPSSSNRQEAIQGADEARRAAYKHTGRYDQSVLRFLDSKNQKRGDQFSFLINNDGLLSSGCKEPLASEEFMALLGLVEKNLVEMGRRILGGEAAISPYRKGSETPCKHCDYMAICRSDPWTQVFRPLKEEEEEA